MKQKKIILFTRPISPPWDEGSKNFAYFLAKHLKTPNMTVYLLTVRGKKISLPPQVKAIPLHPHSRFDLGTKWRLLKFLVSTKAYFIHFIFVPILSTSLLIRLVKFSKKFKAVQTVVSLKTDCPWLIKQLIYGDRLVCFTKKTALLLASAGAKNIQIIPPGVDLTLFKPRKKRNIIVFWGELFRLQSHSLTLKIIPKILTAFPQYQIILGFKAATQREKEEQLLFSQLQNRFGQEKKISFIEVINNMPAFLGQVKLILFPALQTQGKFDLPLVLLEALACGTPIIISPISPLNELLPYRGVYAPEENRADSFLKKIKNILSSNFDQTSKEARKTAEKFFDIKKISQEYQRIYEKL